MERVIFDFISYRNSFSAGLVGEALALEKAVLMRREISDYSLNGLATFVRMQRARRAKPITIGNVSFLRFQG